MLPSTAPPENPVVLTFRKPRIQPLLTTTLIHATFPPAWISSTSTPPPVYPHHSSQADPFGTQVRSHYPSAQCPPMIPHQTRLKAKSLSWLPGPTPFGPVISLAHLLSPLLLFTLFRPQQPPCSSPNMPDPLLPHSLCTGCPTLPASLLAHLLQSLTQKPPSQWICPITQFPQLNFSPLHFSSTNDIFTCMLYLWSVSFYQNVDSMRAELFFSSAHCCIFSTVNSTWHTVRTQ